MFTIWIPNLWNVPILNVVWISSTTVFIPTIGLPVFENVGQNDDVTDTVGRIDDATGIVWRIDDATDIVGRIDDATDIVGRIDDVTRRGFVIVDLW